MNSTHGGNQGGDASKSDGMARKKMLDDRLAAQEKAKLEQNRYQQQIQADIEKKREEMKKKRQSALKKKEDRPDTGEKRPIWRY